MTHAEIRALWNAMKPGDRWKHLKTGKVVTITGPIGHYGVGILHESGRRTCKLDHYFFAEYERDLHSGSSSSQ